MVKRNTPYGATLALYSGSGKALLSNGQEVKCLFKSHQIRSGDIFLACEFDIPIPFVLGLTVEGVEGYTLDHHYIKTKGSLVQVDYLLSPSDIWTNAAFRVNEFEIQFGNTNHLGRLVLGVTNFLLRKGEVIQLNLPDFASPITIRPVKNYNRIVDKIRALRDIDVTCQISIDVGSSNLDVATIIENMDHLCYILSVARGTKVVWVYQENYDEANNLFSVVHSARISKRYCPLYIIDPENTRDTIQFIEQAYTIYKSRYGNYKFDEGLLDAYFDAKAEGDYLQTRGVKLTIAIEMMKNIFVNSSNSSYSEYIIDKKLFKKYNSEIRGVIRDKLLEKGLRDTEIDSVLENISGLNRHSFKWILRALFANIDFQVEEEQLKRFVDSRNSLVHTGRFRTQKHSKNRKEVTEEDRQQIIEEWYFLVAFLDQVFLKLLGYSGFFIDRTVPGKPIRRKLL